MTTTTLPIEQAVTTNATDHSSGVDQKSARRRSAKAIYDAVVAQYIHEISARHRQPDQMSSHPHAAHAGFETATTQPRAIPGQVVISDQPRRVPPQLAIAAQPRPMPGQLAIGSVERTTCMPAAA